MSADHTRVKLGKKPAHHDPRTLQMAVTGMRDLSLITTPPVDRRAVRTIVTRFDEQVLREAVTRELSRGGQVFYVYNRIEGIYEKAQRLHQLFPDASLESRATADKAEQRGPEAVDIRHCGRRSTA